MKKRNVYILLCIASLCIGGGLYVIFRPNTYVTDFARNLLPVSEALFSKLESINCDFIKYYLPDFVWAFSLNCGLNAIFNTKKAVFINGGVVFGIGALWELAQYVGITSGTGDLIDAAMYTLAVLTILILELIGYKKNKR